MIWPKIEHFFAPLLSFCGTRSQQFFHFVADFQNPFYGNRYALGDDISTRLLFDSEGNLAGIQGTVR